jgi:polar amino acid transport system substrate-binding protein
MKTRLAITAALLLMSCATPPAPVAELAPTGTLRIAINYGNAVLATRDAQSGELRGVTVDIGRELGRRLELPVELVGYATVAQLMDATKSGAWDVAFLAVDPARTGELAFTAPYMEVEVTYLVAEGSAFQKVLDVDRAGVRIAVQERNAADLFLSKALKDATLVRAGDESAAYRLFTSGAAQALAGNRQRLLAVAQGSSIYRLLDERFTAIPHAAAVPAGREAAARYLRQFIEELKASGFVAKALERAQLRGVVVARPAAAR